MKDHQKTAMLYVMQGSNVTGDFVVASRSLLGDDITKLWHMPLIGLNLISIYNMFWMYFF